MSAAPPSRRSGRHLLPILLICMVLLVAVFIVLTVAAHAELHHHIYESRAVVGEWRRT
jgi:methionine-rich copper-binding protein CopC